MLTMNLFSDRRRRQLTGTPPKIGLLIDSLGKGKRCGSCGGHGGVK